jgi:hypothetical protein
MAGDGLDEHDQGGKPGHEGAHPQARGVDAGRPARRVEGGRLVGGVAVG